MLLIVKNYYEQQKKDYKIRALNTNGFLLQSHARRNIFTYRNFSKILGSFQYYFWTEVYEQPVKMSTLKNSLENEKKLQYCFFLHTI